MLILSFNIKKEVKESIILKITVVTTKYYKSYNRYLILSKYMNKMIVSTIELLFTLLLSYSESNYVITRDSSAYDHKFNWYNTNGTLLKDNALIKSKNVSCNLQEIDHT